MIKFFKRKLEANRLTLLLGLLILTLLIGPGLSLLDLLGLLKH